jgi:hypothetical protein
MMFTLIFIEFQAGLEFKTFHLLYAYKFVFLRLRMQLNQNCPLSKVE